MTSLAALVLPIFVSAIIVFVASSLIHMVLPWHKDDYPLLPAQDKLLDAMRPFALPPGDYLLPRPADMKDMNSPEFLTKLKAGPVLLMTVMPNGAANMGRNLAMWFAYTLVVSLFAGYVGSATLAPGTPYLRIFQVVGTVAFVGYALALWQQSIWFQRSLRLTVKGTIDGLLYGLLTAGAFGWLWPKL